MILTDKEVAETKVCLIKTFNFFADFCKANSLLYFGCAGTCLGAVRHKGFIPWDDDIDVFMYRKDYDKFISLRNKLKGSGYEILNTGDPGYDCEFAKFCDVNTTIWEVKKLPYIKGVYIDIFPLDEVGDFEVAKELFDRKFQARKKLIGSLYKYNFNDLWKEFKQLHLRGFLNILYNMFIRCHQKEKMANELLKIEDEIKKQRGDNLMYYANYYGFEKSYYPKNIFGKGISVQFENTNMILPERYDLYLSKTYGDYMKLPPVDKRISHHYRYFQDLTKRWKLEDIKKLDLDDQNLINYTYE